MARSTLVYRRRWRADAGVQAHLPGLMAALARSPVAAIGGDVATILAELLANLRHAAADTRTVDMQVAVRARGSAAVLIVTDTARGFDPVTAAGAIDPAADSDGVAASGRGLKIVVSLSERQRYRRLAGCNGFACRVRP